MHVQAERAILFKRLFVGLHLYTFHMTGPLNDLIQILSKHGSSHHLGAFYARDKKVAWLQSQWGEDNEKNEE